MKRSRNEEESESSKKKTTSTERISSHYQSSDRSTSTQLNKSALGSDSELHSLPKGSTSTNRGGPESLFPGKLHDMMAYVEREGLERIVSWIRNGTALKVHDPEKLVEKVLPIFFGHTKYRSFQRQLYMWRFEKIWEGGPDRGGFAHPFFVKGKKSLCSKMSRNTSEDEKPIVATNPRAANRARRMADQNAVLGSKSTGISMADTSLPYDSRQNLNAAHGLAAVTSDISSELNVMGIPLPRGMRDFEVDNQFGLQRISNTPFVPDHKAGSSDDEAGPYDDLFKED